MLLRMARSTIPCNAGGTDAGNGGAGGLAVADGEVEPQVGELVEEGRGGLGALVDALAHGPLDDAVQRQGDDSAERRGRLLDDGGQDVQRIGAIERRPAMAWATAAHATRTPLVIRMSR